MLSFSETETKAEKRAATPPRSSTDLCCRFCQYYSTTSNRNEIGHARGNSARFSGQTYAIWKCPKCETLQTLGTVQFADLYREYPLQRRKLDVFARGTMKNLLKRLKVSGLKSTDVILDYGCGNGIFIEFLRSQGYQEVHGYDPYETAYSTPPAAEHFDFVIANDVLEHAECPLDFIRTVSRCLKPSGVMYVGTADANGVDVHDLTPHLMRLHLPFHRMILTAQSLRALGPQAGLVEVQSWTRSYMDTRQPFCNYRFLDELNAKLGHVIDRAFDKGNEKLLLRHPQLLFWGLFGYWFPSAAEPAVAWRKPNSIKDLP